jgi:hypothetical protein
MKYSIEDLEFLKKKANITYDEAMAQLKKHEGDAVLAILDLEKQGKLRPDNGEKTEKKTGARQRGRLSSLFRKLMAHRLVIKKGDMIIANVSWLFVIIATLSAPWLAVFTFIATMVLGYKYSRTVNWEMNGDEIKAFGNKAAAGFKDITSKVFEEEPARPQQARDEKLETVVPSGESKDKEPAPAQKETSEIIIE